MEEKQKVLLVGVNLNDEFYFFKSVIFTHPTFPHPVF